MTEEDSSETLDIVSKQFLCNTPIISFQWKNLFDNLDYKKQEVLLKRTVNLDLVKKYPLHPHYQRAFLKVLIEHLENPGEEICDDLYNAYGRLVAVTVADEDYFKHYVIERSNRIFSLKENNNLISDGTTGLRTWQAALALSEWILCYSEKFQNKTILELGSGIGLVGLTLAIECKPQKVYLTDCHEKVLEKLAENVELNVSSQKTADGENRVSNVDVLNLPWEEINEEKCKQIGQIDCVIAADIIYDDTLFPPLIMAMDNLAKYSSIREFTFCCTERNTKTLQLFLHSLHEADFRYIDVPTPAQNNFIWATHTPVRIISISKL